MEYVSQMICGLLQIPKGIVIRRLGINPNTKYRTSCIDFNKWLISRIKDNNPTAVVRFGGTEMKSLRKYALNHNLELNLSYSSECNKLCELSGFFPNNPDLIERFCKEYLRLLPETDAIGNWDLAFEKYHIERYMAVDKLIQTDLENLEPYFSSVPWTSALAGKRVLVIHPFAESIRYQYENNRDKLFENKDVLPEFELHTYKAVQSLGGIPDRHCSDWFVAYESMFEDIKELDFDVAILGCGAYGMPLALRLKQQGKIAIHLGGATQMLFGVYGKRWENNQDGLINESWIRPLEAERSQNFSKVENGCYW